MTTKRAWACVVQVLCGLTICAISRGDEGSAHWQQLTAALADVPPMQTAQANFVQRKTTPLLREPIESKGTVRLAEGVLRFDTQEPYETVMLIADGRVTLYDPAASSAERFTLDDSMPALATGLRFDADAMRDAWDLTELQMDDTTLTLSMRPRDAQSDAAAQMSLTLDRRTGFAQQVTLPSSPDETTQLFFSDIQINVPMTPESLMLRLPDDVKVTELDAVGAGR